MNIERFDDEGALSAALATRVLEAIVARPSLVLGLADRTDAARAVSRTARAERWPSTSAIDWSRVRTFNLDEFAGLDAASPNSYRAYMQAELFEHVSIDPANIGFLNGARRRS